MKAQPLAGRGIVITRPASQARRLAERVRAAGGNPILYPAVEILDVADLTPLHALIDRLDQFDMAIFISPNAAAKAMQLIAARRKFPLDIQVVAIGRGGVDALQRFGIRDVIAPDAASRYDSEALLALPPLQHVARKRVVIFRGQGGRELLGDTLAARGAQIEYAECYRRGKPTADIAPLLDAWVRGDVAAAVFTSSEGLRNVHEIMCGAGRSQLNAMPIFVPHPRIAATARELGLTRIVETGAGDDAMVEALSRYFSQS